MKSFKFLFKFVSLLGFMSFPHFMNYLGYNDTVFCKWDKVIDEFWTKLPEYTMSLWTTFYIGVIAIFISILLGVTLGLIIAYFDKWIGGFETVLKFIWSIPLIVVAVYFNIFISNAETYIILMGVFLGIFPIISFAYRKSLEKHDGILSLVATFNLTKIQEFRHLRLREIFNNLSLPLAQSVPLTYIGVTMGEFQFGKTAGHEVYRLGSQFQFAMNYSLFPKMYVTIFLMMFLVFFSGAIFEKLQGATQNLKK